MKQFVLNYQGSKFTESSELDGIDFSSYSTIVEPFGGSFGFIRYLYFTQNLKDKKYIVYDFNKELIDFYLFFKQLGKDREAYVEEYNKLNDKIYELFPAKTKYQLKFLPCRDWINENVKDPIMRWWMLKNIKTSHISRTCPKRRLTDLSIFDAVDFRHSSIQDIDFTEFENNQSFVYFDPPYLFECNTFYGVKDKDVKFCFPPILETFKNPNISCMLVHSKNDYLDATFGDHHFKTYDKIYQNTKKKVLHDVFYHEQHKPTKSFTITQGDCLEELPKIETKSVDLVVVDLPYKQTACTWDTEIDLEAMWKELKRIGKPNTAFVFFCTTKFGYELIHSNPKWFRYDLVWKKSNVCGFFNAKKQPMRVHEMVYIFYKKQPTYNPQMTDLEHTRTYKYDRTINTIYGTVVPQNFTTTRVGKYPQSIQEFPNPNNKRNHPTEKPVSVLEWLIKTYSNENDVVVDFTMGSGSTGVACLNTNRKFIGIEKDDKFFNIAKKRLDSNGEL